MLCSVEIRNNHKIRKYVVLVCSSNQIIYCLIPGTSPTQPRVKLTAGPMCIEMDGPFSKQNKTLPEAQWTQKLTQWLALVANLATRFRLHIWPPSGTTWIGSTFCHQVAPLALSAKLATRLRNLRCQHCLGLSYWHYQLALSLYLHHPESHQLSFNTFSKKCQ